MKMPDRRWCCLLLQLGFTKVPKPKWADASEFLILKWIMAINYQLSQKN